MFPRAYLKELAKERMRRGRGSAIVVMLIASLLGGVMDGGSFNLNTDASSEELLAEHPVLEEIGEIILPLLPVIFAAAGLGVLIALAVQIFVGNVIAVGARGWFLRYMRGEEVAVGELFAAFRIYRPSLVTVLLKNIYIFLWSLLFVIPGIVKSYAYSMTEYIIYENPNLSADKAIQMSCRMTDGYKGELFVLELSWFGWQLLNTFTFGILGLVYVNPYIYATHGAAYEYLKAQAINSGRLTWEDFGQQPPVYIPAEEPPVAD